MMEWELRSEAWTDRHPHEEYNYVIEGMLVVECSGSRVEVGPGDAVRVAAGSLARYSAASYARMLAVYGANPAGLSSSDFAFEVLRPGPLPHGSEPKGLNRNAH
jgi:ethanolamine utilization protein EutQ (cupin superfamily)